MQRKIIAILDTVTKDFAGPLQLHYHEAPAIRLFGDIARMENSQVGRHIKDHHLVSLGTLDDDNNIEPDYKIILTGEQWLNSQDINTDISPERAN